MNTPVDLCAVGKGQNNPDGPPKARPSDFHLPNATADNALLPAQTTPGALGMSAFDSIDNLMAGMGPVSGVRDIWMLPSGSRLPPDVKDVSDNNPPGHHTLYPTATMTWSEFRDGVQGLPWIFVERRR